MVQLLPNVREPSIGERLARASTNLVPGIGQALGTMYSQKRENESLKKLTGQDFEGISPDIKREFVRAQVTGKAQKQLEKENSLQLGLQTINRMKGLISSAGPSNYLKGLFPGETAANRAELESLGRSLIPLVAAGVPIRNQKEFEEYRKIITNPNARQSELEGALRGLENLFQRSLQQSTGEGKSESSEKGRKKMKFSSENPEHKKKAEQLYKTHRDKEKVREILSREFEF